MEYVAPRIDPLRSPAIGFAHRGARAHARENTIEAFKLALSMGATGLESDVWITRDGIPVLDHDGVVGSLLRRRPIADVDRVDLPAHIPTLRQFYGACGTDFEFSLDIKDPAAAEATMAVIHQTEADLKTSIAPRTWLCHPDFDLVASWRAAWDEVRIVHSTRLSRLKDGPERHAALMAEHGIHCMNMRQPDWTGGLVTLFHKFEIHCFSWDVQLHRRSGLRPESVTLAQCGAGHRHQVLFRIERPRQDQRVRGAGECTGTDHARQRMSFSVLGKELFEDELRPHCV